MFLEPLRAWPTHIMTFRAVTLDWHYHWVVVKLCRLQHALRGAMRENIGSVGAMRERSVWDRVSQIVNGAELRFYGYVRTASALMSAGAEGLPNKGVPEMCDYSLQSVRSRPARVGEKLTTRDFGTCTRGFAAAEDAAVAVCVLPGTELAFSSPVTVTEHAFFAGWKVQTLGHATAIFRQVNKDEPWKHHDALEFPDGRIVLLTRLSKGQEATVLQLPAQPTTAAEADAQKRIATVR
ncbi:MAG: hypothetical protein ACXWC8_17915, partial [Limisphaerales bacterium]